MTKDVLVRVSGLQFEVEDNEAIEMIAKGNYYFKNNKHYITYEEILEEEGQITKNTLKIDPNQIEILKRGGNNTHMLFQERQKTMTCYSTPFGDLIVGLFTNRMQVEERENEISATIDYSLEVNYSHVSDCKLELKVMCCSE